MEIFNMDNRFFRLMARLVDLVWINLLTLLCALPIVTAGASFTAMYYLLLQMVEEDQAALTRRFFREFRANLKKATTLWCGILVLLLVYAENIYLLRQGVLDAYGPLKLVSMGMITLIMVFMAMVANYSFALFSRYENDVKTTLKNAALLSVAFFPRSLCIVVIMLFPLALMMLSDYFLWLWFIYGFSFPGYVISMIIVSVFKKTEEAG